MELKNLVPMLNVAEIETSIEFYQKLLAFEMISPVKALSEWRWCMLRSGGCEIMLSQTGADLGLTKDIDVEQDNWPTIFYFYPDDVRALYDHIKKCNYKTTPLEITFYGMREFSLRDPDGHLLSFGEDVCTKSSD